MNTLFTGQVIYRLAQTESTNNYASRLVSEQEVFEGAVVFALEQTSGKGQRGSAWHSEGGKNLTFSIVFKPHFLSIKNQFQLSKAVALGIADFLDNLGLKGARVKWPNDIYVGERKISGILIENQLKGECIEYSIVGIGFNVNQTGFPKGLHATSLKLETHQEHPLPYCLDRLCESIERRYLELRSGKSPDKDYLERLYRFGQWGMFESKGSFFSGKITGVTPEGKLLLETPELELQAFDIKELVFV